jgi:uncharacterized iron-regulated membrane protein
MKPLLLRLHRWLTLIFAFPLAIVVVTGLILSVEPIVTAGAIKPQSLSAAKLSGLLDKHDPDGKARMIALDHNRHRLSVIGGDRRRVTVDLANGERAGKGGASASVFNSARRLHEHFLFGLGWIVTASTMVMLGLITLGVLMGWPTLRNSLSGWHKAMAWFLLPLLVLSPLTGLGLAYRISLSAEPPKEARAAPPASLREAVPIVAKSHDLSRLLWIRKRGKRVLARLLEDGEYRVYAVTRAGVVALPRNWPRLLHEGNGFGTIGALANLVTALAIIGLMATGLTMWGRRTFRRRSRVRRPEPSPVPGE